jgi:VWFA-related protein
MAPVAALLALAAGSYSAGVLAQEPPGDSGIASFGDHIEVSVIELDVGVLDDRGRPIEGLAQSAFAVYEDGRKVELVGFEEVRPPRAAPPTPDPSASAPGLPPPAEGTEARYLAIWVDVAGTDPLHRNRALRQIVESLQGGAFAGWWTAVVAFDGSIDIVQTFTPHASAVAAALQGLEKRPGKPGAGQREWHQAVEELRRIARELGCEMGKDQMIAFARQYDAERHHEIDGSLRALGEFLNSLGGLPSQKDVLALTEGLAVRPGEPLYALIGEWCGDHRLQLEGQALPGLGALDELAALASHRRVRLHPLDAAGLSAFTPHDITAGSSMSPAIYALQRANQGEVPAVLAQRSGGRALVNTNDFRPDLTRLSATLGHFYRLAYRPRRDGDDREHRLRVEVSRPGATVQHRRAHRDRSGAMRLADRTVATLWYDLEHNPLEVELSFGTPQGFAPGLQRVPARLRIPLRNVSLVAQGALHMGQLELFAASRDARGRRSVPQRFVMPLQLAAEDLDRGFVIKDLELTLREGSNTIAFTVFDGLAGVGSYLLRTLEPMPPAEVAPASPPQKDPAPARRGRARD